MLPSVVCLLIALGLALLAAWSRTGGSPAARWWVRRGPAHGDHALFRTEALGLVIVPWGAQLALVVAIGSWPGLPAVVPLVLLVAELLLGVVLMVIVGYRRVLPAWVHPAWLRDERRRELAALRTR